MHHVSIGRRAARLLWVSSLAASSWAAQAGYSSYGELLRAVDWPEGRSMFSGPAVDGVERAWKEAQPLELVEVPLAPTKDRSRVLTRYVSAGRPIPAQALKVLRYDADRSQATGPRA